MTSTFRPQLSRISSDEQMDAPEDFQRSRLYRAIRKGDSARVLNAIHRGANIHLYHHSELSTYLHLVVTMANPNTEDKFLPMVYILSIYGVEVNAQDIRGKTALELAIDRGLRYIMVALIRIGTDLTDRDYKSLIQRIQGPYQVEMMDNFEKFEPGLWGAVKHNQIGQTQLLLNSWCRVNVMKSNKTLIDYATITRKSEELVKLLRDSETNLEFVHATLAGDEHKMREFLSEYDCDPYTMDISYQEPGSETLCPRSLRDTVVAMGNNHVLHLLPREESDADSQENERAHFDDLFDEEDEIDFTYASGHRKQRDLNENYAVVDPEQKTLDAVMTTSDPTHYSDMQLDMNRLDLNDEYDEADIIYSSRHLQQQELIYGDLQRKNSLPSRNKKGKKYKPRYLKKGESVKEPRRASYTADEGYNSTWSSVQSEADSSFSQGRKPNRENSCPADLSSRGDEFKLYKQYYDGCYYLTAEENNDEPAMMVLTTPRGETGSDVTGRRGSNSSTLRGLKSGKSSISKGASTFNDSVKSKTKKSRPQIYWSQDNTGEAETYSAKHRSKSHKSKRKKSLRVDRHRFSDEEEDGDQSKSKMCVIQ